MPRKAQPFRLSRVARKHKLRKADHRPSAGQRGYGATWRKLRRLILAGEPLCRECGRVAREVDHIKPLAEGGDNSEANLQALCKTCHSRKTGRKNPRRGGWGQLKGRQQ